ncbi:MAG: serine protease inhibitor [Synechococcaceae cyanobacterium]|nr:serine protease inhibitor [Synechococcaceae cyanobacterium]
MTASFLTRSSLTPGLLPAAGDRPASSRGTLPLGRRVSSAPGIPLMLLAVWLLAAVLVAPEQPLDQEAICQRHNGVEACRVW